MAAGCDDTEDGSPCSPELGYLRFAKHPAVAFPSRDVQPSRLTMAILGTSMIAAGSAGPLAFTAGDGMRPTGGCPGGGGIGVGGDWSGAAIPGVPGAAAGVAAGAAARVAFAVTAD